MASHDAAPRTYATTPPRHDAPHLIAPPTPFRRRAHRLPHAAVNPAPSDLASPSTHTPPPHRRHAHRSRPRRPPRTLEHRRRRATSFKESEEDRTDEDREYREELGDDYSEGSYDSEGYSD
ncbi:hypothetical protein SORBI_3003G166001 [Sorghum bicolor]|uniref:Uncharacterized protein n=1 Tax=Sorghum bicolor TaxID=4558 RepID=A0A1W0VXM6_SORBI|nr:hypothetical protein SORBI_3003G166001 [Sorghum bicolor]